MSLQRSPNISTDAKADACRRQRDDAQQKELPFVVFGVPVGVRRHANSNRKRRQFHDFPALEGRLMSAKPDAGPVGRLLRIRKWLALLNHRAQKFMHEVRMGTTVARPLRETEMRLLGQVINSFGGEALDRLGQE